MNKKKKRILAASFAVVLALWSLILWYRWDSGTNHGFTFGYYGHYNTVSNALSKMPGVIIIATGYNADVTLEEFGFDVRTTNGAILKIWFSEQDPVRRMKGEKLNNALANKIAEALSANH